MKGSGLLPVLARSIKQFKSKTQTASYAAAIAEAIHIVIKTYDSLSSLDAGQFRVKTGARRKNTASQVDNFDHQFKNAVNITE